MRFRRILLAPLFASALLLAAFAAPSRAFSQVVADPYESAVEYLRIATHPQRDGSHLPLLFALRQLRDPDLKSVFLQLVQQGAQDGQWQMQVHAALGLAEIDPTRQVDPFIITQIDGEAQEAVVATALDLKLLPEPAMLEVLKWDRLNSMARLFVLAEQQAMGKPVDTDELSRLSKSDESHVAAMSSVLLAQAGDASALNAFDALLKSKTETERLAVLLWTIDAVRRYKLTALADWIDAAMADPAADPDVDYRGTLALLTMDPARGLAAWENYLGAEPSFAHRVRCGTMLLASRSPIPASAYDRLLPAGDDEELISRIVDVGKAFSASTDPGDALIALLDVGHMKTSIWATEALKNLPPEQSRRVYEYLIDRMNQPKPQWTDGVAQTVEATTRLFEIDPQAVLTRLKSAEDDGPQQQAILLGLFETDSPEPGVVAAELPRIGSGRADSLALLLYAKHAKSLTPEELKHLGTIASGGGRVSEILQIQAGWLYLKHAGKTEQAIAAVFAKNP